MTAHRDHDRSAATANAGRNGQSALVDRDVHAQPRRRRSGATMPVARGRVAWRRVGRDLGPEPGCRASSSRRSRPASVSSGLNGRRTLHDIVLPRTLPASRAAGFPADKPGPQQHRGLSGEARRGQPDQGDHLPAQCAGAGIRCGRALDVSPDSLGLSPVVAVHGGRGRRVRRHRAGAGRQRRPAAQEGRHDPQHRHPRRITGPVSGRRSTIPGSATAVLPCS